MPNAAFEMIIVDIDRPDVKVNVLGISRTTDSYDASRAIALIARGVTK